MKKQTLAWLVLIICFNLLLSSSSETNQKPMITEEKQCKGVDRIKRSYKGMHEMVQYRNLKELKEFNVRIHNSGHKGKGANGGGNLVRPRSKKGAANSLLPQSSSLSSLLRHASTLGLLIFLSFF